MTNDYTFPPTIQGTPGSQLPVSNQYYPPVPRQYPCDCPYCGRCPHCGRGSSYPYFYPLYPYTISPYPITTYTITTYQNQ